MSSLRSQFQRPEGALLESARTARRPIMSVKVASARAGISEASWRAYVNGYRSLTAGNPIQMIAPAATLARMADALDLRPADLEAADRPDAAFLQAGGSLSDLDPALTPRPSDAHIPRPFTPDPAVEFIESQRLAADPPLSLRKAAAAARISYTQWRNLTLGMPRLGYRIQVHATAAVVARMAEAVGAAPENIAERGRPDAAAHMVKAEEVRAADDDLERHWARLTRDLQVISPDELERLAIDIDQAASHLAVWADIRGPRELVHRLIDGAHRLCRIADFLESLQEQSAQAAPLGPPKAVMALGLRLAAAPSARSC